MGGTAASAGECGPGAQSDGFAIQSLTSSSQLLVLGVSGVMHSDSARDTASFFATLLVVFVSSFVVAIPLFALGLGASMVIVAPLALGIGALVASFSRWVMGRILDRPGRRPGFLRILLRGESTALLVLIALVLLTMSGVPLLPRIVPITLSMTIISYRVTALE